MNYLDSLDNEYKKRYGIVYTPYFIVEYIIKNTLKSYTDKYDYNTVKDIKIIDPCCGTGNFLIPCFDFLIDYHKNILNRELTLNEMEYILNNNIYGMDIDSGAITYLRNLIYEKYGLYPKNIIQGDSLRHVFKQKFDIIISNPPYINIENMFLEDKQYYKNNYIFFNGRSDVFNVFLELSLRLIEKEGFIGFIIPFNFVNNTSYKKTRDYLLENGLLIELCYTGNKVFEGVLVDTCIIILNNVYHDEILLKNSLNDNGYFVTNNYFKKFNNILSVDSECTVSIINKLYEGDTVLLDDYVTIFQGIVSGANNIFIFKDYNIINEYALENDLIKPFLFGRDITRYSILNTDNLILYVTKNTQIDFYPNVKKYLENYKQVLSNKREVKKGSIPYYSLHWSRDNYFKSNNTPPKIIIQTTRNEKYKNRINATLDIKGEYYTDRSIWNIFLNDTMFDIKYVLGLLNSKVINYLFYKKFLNVNIKKEYLENIPIPIVSVSQQKIVIDIVDKLLDNVDFDENIVKLDNFIYELYGLDNEDIKIIESTLAV